MTGRQADRSAVGWTQPAASAASWSGRRALEAAGIVALAAALLLVWAASASAAAWELQRAATPSLGADDDVRALFALDGGTAWVAGTGDSVHYTHDGGRSWIPEATGAPGTTNWRAVHFADRRHGLVAGADGRTGLIFATADGGQTWKQVLRVPGVRFTGLEFNGTELGWASGRGGTVYATEDGGATWTKQRAATETHLNAVAFAGWYEGGVIGDRGIAVGDRGTILRTADGGKTWEHVRARTTRRLRDVAYVTRRVAYAVGGHGTVLKTTSWGHRWKRLAVPAHGADCVAVDFASEAHGLVALAGGKLLDTQDGGRTWHVVKHGLGDLGALRDLDFALPPEGTQAARAVAHAKAAATGRGDESTDPTRGWIVASDGSVSRYIASGTSTHDNWVYLYPTDAAGYYDPPSYSGDAVCPRTTDFSFDLADYAISYGQPYDGWTTKTGADGSMSYNDGNYFAVDFIAGRHHTETPADLFTAYTNSTALCCGMSDSTPGDLNFAFYGTLTTGATSTDVAFGQGDYDGDNNWWIGSATFSKPHYDQLVTADGVWKIAVAPNGNYDGFMFTWDQ